MASEQQSEQKARALLTGVRRAPRNVETVWVRIDDAIAALGAHKVGRTLRKVRDEACRRRDEGGEERPVVTAEEVGGDRDCPVCGRLALKSSRVRRQTGRRVIVDGPYVELPREPWQELLTEIVEGRDQANAQPAPAAAAKKEK